MFLGTMIVLISSCGSKQAATSYNPTPTNKVRTELKHKRRDVREVDKLAAKATDRMRAVGVGNDMDEKYARREAMRDAQLTLVSYIETTVTSTVTEHYKKTTANNKKLSVTDIESFVRTAVSQTISTRAIGLPEVADVSDGTVTVYVCLELVPTTAELLGDVYDRLPADLAMGADYYKDTFIKDNKERLEKFRFQVKQEE